MQHHTFGLGGTLASASCAAAAGADVAAPGSKSASCLSCFTRSSDSPSFMACLKPLTAAPRSEPMERRRLVPKITSAIARITNNIFESNISLLRFHVDQHYGANDTPKPLCRLTVRGGCVFGRNWSFAL